MSVFENYNFIFLYTPGLVISHYLGNNGTVFEADKLN